MKYRDENGVFQDLYLPPTGDTLPIGAIVEYSGTTIPYGWESYSTGKIRKTTQTVGVVGTVADEYTEDTRAVYNAPYINDCNKYSTDEVFTGKYWIDGKKIYGKTFVNPSIAISTSGSTLGTISNIDTWTGSDYRISAPNSKNSGRTGYLNSSYYSGIQVSTNGTVSVYGHDGQNNVYAQVTIEYTKTTD